MALPVLPPIRSVSDLQTAVAQGHQPEYLFFWGHTTPAHGAVGKECFSQWYPATFEENGTRYPTAEHYMMAEKARLFGDDDTRAAILRTTHPNDAKRLGRKIAPFDEATWTAARMAIVVRGNALKFGQHPALATFLRQTGARVLVEASPVDSIWGIGLAQDSPHAAQPTEWRGLNLLGFALMEVRDQLS
ncbi:NADAR family protein [Hymenobacter terrenus]|uniref:NADAR family protein n=1 Tax=Hymenobacter terrenus TaxID=1629124 RepID=UPI00061947F4|nr:NADAR family protein [Hymenobacter terrenus]